MQEEGRQSRARDPAAGAGAEGTAPYAVRTNLRQAHRVPEQLPSQHLSWPVLPPPYEQTAVHQQASG